MNRKQLSVARAVLVFALSASLVLVLVGIAGVFVLRRVGTGEAIRQARDLTVVVGRRIVQPRLTNGILRGDAESLRSIDSVLVSGSVIRDPVVRVKIWDPSGLIVYSDEPELIGERFQLGAEELDALRTGAVEADLSDLSKPENRFERRYGKLLEVYLPVQTPDGHRLLFEAYLRFDSVAASGRQLWQAFLPVLTVALLALGLLQIPLAYRLARRVRDSQREREGLLQRAIDSSDLERRRIARDLHDGPVQQLAGLSMSLSAAADGTASSDPTVASTLRDAASRTRQGMRSLRSALMGIYPPTLRQAGLAAALSDLAEPLSAYGVRTQLDIPADLEIPSGVESLLFRASQEVIRNIAVHAGAENVVVRVAVDDSKAVLEIRDDGKGFTPEMERAAREDGHFGLQLLSDVARAADGSLEVDSSPGEGTRIRLEVPLR
jgi:signal transduction histidine kinase